MVSSVDIYVLNYHQVMQKLDVYSHSREVVTNFIAILKAYAKVIEA